MTMTNSGNQYKFRALMNRRSNPTTVTVQGMTKKGWGAPHETRVFGNETPEQVVERLNKLNSREFRLAK